MAEKVAKKLEKNIVANKKNANAKKIEKISDEVSNKIVKNSKNIETAKKVASNLVSKVLKDPKATFTSKTIISKIAHKIITKSSDAVKDSNVLNVTESEEA